jgi:L-ascorbate metabolism protein UlaG (beta-lactamase superfamily)
MRARVAAVLAILFAAVVVASQAGCVVSRGFAPLFGSPAKLASRVTDPVRPEARIAVLWVGHATMLLQIDDKFVLTDPVFTETVGVLSRRLVEPGLAPEALPPLDAVIVSHMHYDHLSQSSLAMVASKARALVLPEGGLVYVPGVPIPARELRRFERWESGGLAITAVPVKHVGWRYGLDAQWRTYGFTGYVIEYHGLTVYFGGDTAYCPACFGAVRTRFPHIDLALVPIAPIAPRSFMRHTHVDPEEALATFDGLGARVMVPMHFDTFVNSEDVPGAARSVLEGLVREHGMQDRVAILRIGEQRVIVPRTAPGGQMGVAPRAPSEPPDPAIRAPSR